MERLDQQLRRRYRKLAKFPFPLFSTASLRVIGEECHTPLHVFKEPLETGCDTHTHAHTQTCTVTFVVGLQGGPFQTRGSAACPQSHLKSVSVSASWAKVTEQEFQKQGYAVHKDWKAINLQVAVEPKRLPQEGCSVEHVGLQFFSSFT